MDAPSHEPPERVLPRIYTHFMAFAAMSVGYFYGLTVLGHWHHLDEAVGLLLIA